LKRRKGYPTSRVEANTFTLEESSLIRLVSRPNADFAPCIYDALPGDSRSRWQRMERVTNQARLPRQAGEPRYLAVGGYTAAWYPRHHVVDAAMETFRGNRLHGELWRTITRSAR
jgi:hypothetical protein